APHAQRGVAWGDRARGRGVPGLSDLTSHFVVAPDAAFDAHLGHEFLTPTTSRLTLRAAHLGSDGTVRSGVYAAVAESLASTGTAVEVLPQGFFPSGLSNATHVVGDAREGVLEDVACCRARGARAPL